MALTERLALLLTADVDDAVKGLQKVSRTADKDLSKAEKRLDKLGHTSTKVGATMMAAGGVAAVGLFDAGKAASDLNETVSQTEQIFGDAAGSVGEFAEGAASIGQSERAAREAANTFGLFFTNAGKSGDEAAEMSVTMAALASDMASFKNTTPEDAVEALGAALRGESEPIRRYGVMLDDATLKQRALDMGLVQTTTGTLPPAIKQQAAYAEILEQTTTIQGDYERTSEGFANKQRELAAEWENLKASIGEAALPAMQKAQGAIGGLLDTFNSLPGPMQDAIGTFAVAGTGFLLAGGAAATVAGQVIKMRHEFPQATKAVKGFTKAIAGIARAHPVLLGIAAAAAAATAAFAAFSDKGVKPNADRMAELSDIIKDQNGLVGDNTEAWLQNQLATEAQNDVGQEILKLMDRAGPSIEDLNTALAENTMDEFQAELVGAATEADTAGINVFELGTALETLGVEFSGAIDLGKATEGVLSDTAETTEELEEATTGVTEQYKEAKTAIEEAESALSDYFDEINGNLDRNLALEAAVDDLTNSLFENGATLDIGTEKGRANIQAAQDQAQAILDLGVAHVEAGGSVQEGIDITNIHTAAMIQQMRQAGFSDEAINQLLTDIGLTPDQVSTTFTTPGLDEARFGVALLHGEIMALIQTGFGAALGQFKHIQNAGGILGFTANQGKVFAEGGTVNKPTFGLIGEAGPEVVIPLSRSKRGRAAQLMMESGLVPKFADGGTFSRTSFQRPTRSAPTGSRFRRTSPTAAGRPIQVVVDVDGRTVARQLVPHLRAVEGARA